MKANHLSVTSLEEYEPNREFVGRNFNAGEVIQLVLRAPYSGHWLSFRSVQMVMIHELAHCAQMNHSAAFWKVRNSFADELRVLWGKDYTGDGFWGKGETLLSAQYNRNGVVREEEVLPSSLCGGTFRSGRKGKRKRKRGVDGQEKSSLTYAERQQRRIARKFGNNGVKLGEDELTRIKLEDAKRPKGKPRVAGSARGRELRAAAALARFGDKKLEKAGELKKEEDGSESETESDYEDVGNFKEAVDINGVQILDSNGNGMVKICEDEGQDDVFVKQEMEELQQIDSIGLHEPKSLSLGKETKPPVHIKKKEVSISMKHVTQPNPIPESQVSSKRQPLIPRPPDCSSTPRTHSHTSNSEQNSTVCPICSLANEASAVTCLTCSHVLRPENIPGHWKCDSVMCGGSQYINGGDCGVCGVCGSRRSKGWERRSEILNTLRPK